MSNIKKKNENVARDKYWEELNQEEKINRLSKVIERLNECNRRLENKISKLESHTHTGDTMSIPYKERDFEFTYFGVRKNVLNRDIK